jgi:hypothetical protein
MNIIEATRSYDAWLAQLIDIDQRGLELKRAKMHGDAMSFFRATFYRWAQLWTTLCPNLADAPVVFSVGDLHIENLGKWRDTEGRLVWGVSDHDEAHELPYPNDLVRLATSVFLALRSQKFSISRERACEEILAGYGKGLEKGVKPFLLEEENFKLRQIALGHRPDPRNFWRKMDQLQVAVRPPAVAIQALEAALPRPGLEYTIHVRQSGAGSLGRPRFVLLTHWRGGRIAREAKTLAPSACHWAADARARPSLVSRAPDLIRLLPWSDPFLSTDGPFLTRRLAPNCTKIELGRLTDKRSQSVLLKATGRETANVHLCAGADPVAVSKHFRSLGGRWLLRAASAMEEQAYSDWSEWKRSA